MVRNLLETAPPESGELFEGLLENGCVDIELIVSSESPEAALYNQPHDEAVLLIDGSATLEIAGEIGELERGDFLIIPANTPHRVLKTENGTRWLAIHMCGGRK